MAVEKLKSRIRNLIVLFLSVALPVSPLHASEKSREAFEKLVGPVPKVRNAMRRVKNLPDFDKLRSMPGLPDPLVMNDGTRVTTEQQWSMRREEIKRILQDYAIGHMPPPPRNLKAKLLSSERQTWRDIEYEYQVVELSFGPGQAVKLRLSLAIPNSKGPLPALIYADWYGKIGLRGQDFTDLLRGYVRVCWDLKDPDDFGRHYPEYDWGVLARGAWATSRCVDYLETLDLIDSSAIAVTGWSRCGKIAMIAGAFDERIAATIPVGSSGSGTPPYRYRGIAHSKHWLIPSMTLFVGREEKLPFDQHFFGALIAPRALLTVNGFHDEWTDPWLVQQFYLESRKVYEFLGAEEKIGIHTRTGNHAFLASDHEAAADWCDRHFYGKQTDNDYDKVPFPYSFEQWLEISGDQAPRMQDWPALTWKNPASVSEWEKIKPALKERIKWVLGTDASGSAPKHFTPKDTNYRLDTKRPDTVPKPVSGSNKMQAVEMGGGLTAYLTLPKNLDGKRPAVVWLHPARRNYGWWIGSAYLGTRPFSKSPQSVVTDVLADAGYVAIGFDQVGHGTRYDQGDLNFYKKHPRWSELGQMVADARRAVDVLCSLDYVDQDKIIVLGHGLGGIVAVHAAALDERIKAVVSVDGFSPLRSDKRDADTVGIRSYSKLLGLAPRMGFFVGNEQHLPYDYDELMAMIAPRPMLINAGELNYRVQIPELRASVDRARGVYSLYSAGDALTLEVPHDYYAFWLWPDRKQGLVKWLDSAMDN